MTIVVKKWGNSLAFRIPKEIANALSVDNNSLLDLELTKDGILLKPKKASRLQELVAQIDETNIHKEVDTGKKVGHEEW